MFCAELNILSNLKMVKEANEILNLSHKMLKLLRSGNDGALLQACKEDQKISSIPALSWRILPGSEIVEWCPVPLLDSHDQEMLIYDSIFVL